MVLTSVSLHRFVLIEIFDLRYFCRAISVLAVFFAKIGEKLKIEIEKENDFEELERKVAQIIRARVDIAPILIWDRILFFDFYF